MKNPYFSILIPTKNRSQLLENAVHSVLNQDFSDLEIIVSDNDDGVSKSGSVIEKFSDARIKYKRTGGLSMVENWQVALEMASGKNVIQVIKLKDGLDSDTAKKINKAIKESGIKAQSSIQGDKIRVTDKKRDTLQQIMAFLKEQQFGVPLQFNNFKD